MMYEAKGENKRLQIAIARPSRSSASAINSTIRSSPTPSSSSSTSSTRRLPPQVPDEYARDRWGEMPTAFIEV